MPRKSEQHPIEKPPVETCQSFEGGRELQSCEIPGCATAVGLGRKSGLCRAHAKEGLDLFFASESDPEVLTKVERWVNMGFEPIEIGRLLLQEKYRQKRGPK